MNESPRVPTRGADGRPLEKDEARDYAEKDEAKLKGIITWYIFYVVFLLST